MPTNFRQEKAGRRVATNQQVRERENWVSGGKRQVAQTQERCGHERHQEVRRPGLGWKHRIVLQACKKRLGSCILLFTRAETWAYLWREWTWVALDSPNIRQSSRDGPKLRVYIPNNETHISPPLPAAKSVTTASAPLHLNPEGVWKILSSGESWTA